MSLLWFFLSLVFLMGFAQLYTAWKISNLRELGVYPQKGEATIPDVIRLRDAGLNTWAIRCYREINKVGLREAKSSVSGLGK